MSELRNRMERLGDRALVEQGAFERLERRRGRKVRNRRIGAGVLALVLTVGGSVAAFSAFSGGDSEQTIGGVEVDDGFHALWPETTLAEATAAQEAVEAGDPDLGFRLSADATAAMFATDVLLLEQFTIDGMNDIELPVDHRTGPVVVEIATLPLPTLPLPCPAPTDGASVCGPSIFTVTLERLVGPDGVWLVTAVESPELSLADYLGAEVVPGQTSFDLPTSLPDGQLVSAGFATTGSCQAAGETEVEVTDGLVRFQLQNGPTGCNGYLYLMHPPTPEGSVPIGQIMFGTVGNDKPDLAYHVQTMAAVPVRFVPEASTVPGVPDTARVTCTGADITVETPVVRVQPDGFHITLVNEGNEEVSFSVMQDLGATSGTSGDVPVSSGQNGGVGAPPGETDSVWVDGPPGRYSLSCASTPEPGQWAYAGIGTLEVVDPEGLYVPDELQCATGEAYGSAGDYPGGTTGFAGDPLQVARDHVSGLEFDDLVERAGYPESEQPVIRIVRDGAVVGRVTLRSDGAGGWLDGTIEGCGGTLFGWSAEPTGVSGPVGEPGTVLLVLCEPVFVEEGNNSHSGTDLQVDGQGIDFDTSCLMAPAGERLTILFSNLDEGVQRNISIYTMTPCLQERLLTGLTVICGDAENDLPIFSGEIITGVSEIVYELRPLDPGFYYFHDDVHPGANGVLIVA